MNIFKKRPLFMLLCIIMGGFSLFFRAPLAVYLTAGILLLITLGVLILLRSKKRISALPLAAVVCLLCVLIGAFVYSAWFSAAERFPRKSVTEGTVTEIRYATENGSAFVMQSEHINHAPLSSYRLSVQVDKDCSTLSIGDRVALVGEICYTVEAAGGEALFRYDLAQGINGYIAEPEAFSYTEGKVPMLTAFFTKARQAFDAHITGCATGEAGALLSALLIGNRDGLSGQTVLDFSRTGLTHILAVSGMHLSLLTLAINAFLSLLRIHKKLRIAVECMFILFYIGLSGFSPSIVRAGIMLLFSFMLFLLGYRGDSPTTLAISCFLICCFTPYSIFDVSLLLSAFATGGVLFAVRFTEQRDGKERSPWLSGVMAAGISVSAIAFTIWITALTFSTTSLMAPLYTLVFSFLIELYMYFGGLCLVFGLFLPISPVLTPLGNVILWGIGKAAELPGAYIRIDFLPAKIYAVIFTILLFLFLTLPVKHKKRAVGALFVLYLGYFALTGVLSARELRTPKAVYVREETEEWILLREGGETTVLDMSYGTNQSVYTLDRLLSEEHILSLDHLVITQYKSSLYRSLPTLLSRTAVHTLYLPAPASHAESELFEILQITLSSYRVRILTYDHTQPLRAGACALTPLYRAEKAEGGRIAFSLSHGEQTLTYLSSGVIFEQTMHTLWQACDQSTTVIYGAYGRAYASPIFVFAPSEQNHRVIVSGERLLWEELFYAQQEKLLLCPSTYELMP